MLAHPLVACFVMSGIGVGQAVATCAVDLNKTHATNPLWPPHARFHIAWQIFNTVLFALAEMALLWWPGPSGDIRFYLAAGMLALVFLAFWLALETAHLYGGALFDLNGTLPVPVSAATRSSQSK